MRINHQDDKQVAIDVSPDKARDLLDGIIAHRDELGELGAELEQQLRAAGVEPTPTPEHIRYEYMPPTDLHS